MSKIKKLFATALMCAAYQTVQAAVIPLEAGFVPLQYTKNLSIAEFLSGVGDWNQSYHLASHTEIMNLLDIYSITTHPAAPFSHNEFAFIFYIGGHTLGPYGTYFSDGNQGAIGRSLEDFVNVGLTNGENGAAYENCPMYNECSSPTIQYATQSLTYKDDRSGLFLVAGAAVPEPVSVALFALGLGALALRRRAS